MAKKTTNRVGGLNLASMDKGFLSYKLRKEDDVKLHFYAEIMKPLVQALNPNGVNDYCSENVLRAGGRTDATFQTISFEFKKDGYFRTNRGIDEALYGRDENDHGLFDYIINNAGIDSGDAVDAAERKIAEGVGVGFDDKRFVFARFVRSANEPDLVARKSSVVLPTGMHMLGLDSAEEAYYVCGVINSRSVANVIDGYAIGTNRGVDVLKYVAVPRYDATISLHKEIAVLSRDIHALARRGEDYEDKESLLDEKIVRLFL